MDFSSICEESTWNVNINGTRGKLTITLANSNNIVKSIMNLNSPPTNQKLGTHDSVSPKLTFVRIMDTISTLLQIQCLDYLLSTSAGAGDVIADYFDVLPESSLFSSPSGIDSIHRTIFG